MEKQIVTKPKNEVALASDPTQWGTAALTAQDILIPQIHLQQPMSDKVTAGDAAFGEFRSSDSNELFGKFEEGFEVIPFHMEKVFQEYNVEDPKKKEWLRTIPVTPQNENLPYEDESIEAGKKIKISRDRVMRFFVLLPKELELGTAIPYTISARRTSLKAGKKLVTQMYVRNINSGKTPASVMVKVLAKKETNDQGTYAVLDFAPTTATSEKYLGEALRWLRLITSGKAKVDESQDRPETVASIESGPAKF